MLADHLVLPRVRYLPSLFAIYYINLLLLKVHLVTKLRALMTGTEGAAVVTAVSGMTTTHVLARVRMTEITIIRLFFFQFFAHQILTPHIIL